MQISLKSNFRALERELGKLPTLEQPKIIAASLNKAVAKGFTTSKRAIADILQVKQNEFTRGNQGRRMYWQRANPRKLSASIHAVGRPFNLTRFVAVQGGDGVSATVMGRQRNVPGAFRMNKRGGAIVRRNPNARMPSRKAGIQSDITKHNMKLDQIWGASAADALRIKAVQEQIAGRVGDELPIEYARALQGYVRRLNARLARGVR